MTDYLALAKLIEAEQAKMIWDDKVDLHGTEFYAEALRRVIERSYPVTGLVTQESADKRCADAERTRDFNRDQVEHEHRRYIEAIGDGDQKLKQFQKEGAKPYAAALREKGRHLTSKYRREGVFLAAYWLDGQHKP